MPEPAFDLAAVERELAGTGFSSGQIRHFGIVGSTNQLALEAADAGQRQGVWVADEQTAGRGRGGHTWHSAAGDGLYLSALVSPRLPISEARWLPLRTGLAVQAAVREVTGLALDLRWPNDLMFASRKCGGMLVESGSEPAVPNVPSDWPPDAGLALRFAVIGIGLNVRHNAFPPELAHLATSLLLESSRLFDREPLVSAILCQLDREGNEAEISWRQGTSGTDVCDRFTAASSWVRGKRVRVGADEAGHGGYTGITCGLDPQGFLRVQDDEGQLQLVVSGNVRAARE